MRRRRNHGSRGAAEALAFFSGLNRASADRILQQMAPRRRVQPAAASADALTLRPRAVAARAANRYILAMPYSRFDPERRQRRLQRLRQIPVRRLVPNVITLLALCAGLTGIRLAFEGRYELALARDRVRRHARCGRRPRRAHDQGHVALRR